MKDYIIVYKGTESKVITPDRLGVEADHGWAVKKPVKKPAPKKAAKK